MNIRLSNTDVVAPTPTNNLRYQLNNPNPPLGYSGSQPIKGPKTPEGMCLYYLRRMLSDYPQYVGKLYLWFRDRPELFQWYDPGECLLLPLGEREKTGVLMRLEIQKEKNPRTGKYRYLPVEVEFTFAEIDVLPEPKDGDVPKEML